MAYTQYPLVKDGNTFYRDLKGHSFGRLYVLARVIRSKSKRPGNPDRHWWKCKCVCGRITRVHTQALVSGATRSCGCLSKHNIAKPSLCPVFRAIIIDHRINTTKSTAEIGRYFGVTKNSVIGILDRAGMCESKDPEPQTMDDRLSRFTFPTIRQCAYPNGTPWEPGFSWCLQPVKSESSFCPVHHAACYIDESKSGQKSGSIETADFTQQRINRSAGNTQTEANASDPEIAEAVEVV